MTDTRLYHVWNFKVFLQSQWHHPVSGWSESWDSRPFTKEVDNMRSRSWMMTMILYRVLESLSTMLHFHKPPIYQVLLLHTKPWVRYWERWALMCVYVCMCVYICVHVSAGGGYAQSSSHAQLFATCLPGSSVHGISQARILEWEAIPFSRRSSWLGDRTCISCISCIAEDLGFVPGLGRSPGEENGYPLQYSCLENPMTSGAWRDIVHSITNSWIWLKHLSTHACTYMYIYLYISSS